MGKPVRNIKNVKNSKNRKNVEVSVIIMSDRAGYRMKSYGPMPLLNFIGKKKLIDYQVRAINKHLKVKEIILIIGFKAQQIIKKIQHTITIVENIDHESNNIVKSMAIGTNAATTENVLFVDGNIFMANNFFSKFQPTFSQIFLHKSITDQEEPVGSVVNKDNKIEHSLFSVTQNHWQNITFMTGTELEIFKSFCNNEDKQKWYAFEATNEITNTGGHIKAYYPQEYIINIDAPKQIKKAVIYASSHS